MEIHTPRLVLKPLSEADKGAMLEMIQSEKINRTYMVPQCRTREEEDRVFEALLALSASSEHYFLGIYADEVFVGFVNDVEIEGDSVEIGWAVHPAHQGRGYATEAAKGFASALLEAGFRTVTAGAFVGNAASFRVMEKLGMHRIEKEEDIPYRGEMRHCIYFAADHIE